MGAYHLSECTRWDERWIMARVFPKSGIQPEQNGAYHLHFDFPNCFRLMRDWKLESLVNGKEISAIPFRTDKEEYMYLWRYSTISKRNFRKISYHLTLNWNFRIFWPNGKHPSSSYQCQQSQKENCTLVYQYSHSDTRWRFP